LPGECQCVGVVASALSLAEAGNHSQDFVLSVQECKVDDTEEGISELFFLAAATGLDSLRFLGRYPGRR